MDADIGVKELGFTYMRGEFAHSGFPEQSYDRMATSLVARGYKVSFVIFFLPYLYVLFWSDMILSRIISSIWYYFQLFVLIALKDFLFNY